MSNFFTSEKLGLHYVTGLIGEEVFYVGYHFGVVYREMEEQANELTKKLNVIKAHVSIK